MSGTQDVESVNFHVIGGGNGPHDCRITRDKQVKVVTARRRYLFRIINTRTGKVVGQDHRRRSHRPRERTSPCLIHTRDTLDATGVKSGFAGKIRHASEAIHPIAHCHL
jgi:hypothetical protein